MRLSADAFAHAILGAGVTPVPAADDKTSWLPAEVTVEGAGGSARIVGVVNLAAAHCVAQLRPLLVAELTAAVLPSRYVFVLQNGIEINSRQEEAWPSQALHAGGVRLRPTSTSEHTEAAPSRQALEVRISGYAHALGSVLVATDHTVADVRKGIVDAGLLREVGAVFGFIDRTGCGSEARTRAGRRLTAWATWWFFPCCRNPCMASKLNR